MASNTPRSFHLFNCDNLCKLSEVEALLKAVKGKIPFKILHIKTHEFRREQIEEIFVSKITNLGKMDYAVFVVHAAEACLSFSDDSGYGKIYGALKEQTGSGEKVLIVISGDKNYKSKSEEDQFFLSQWAKDNISPQFRTELVDGRKSFIFSWNQKHRPIHEKALLHYFDPNKNGQKFAVSQTDPAATSTPPRGPSVSLSHHFDLQQEDLERSEPESADQERSLLKQNGKRGQSQRRGQKSWSRSEEDGGRQTSDATESESTVSSENSGRGDSRPILKLQTRLRRGKISYDSADVEIWDQTWRPPHSEVVKLEREWGSTPEAYLKIFADENGTMCRAEVIPRSSLWDYCWPS